MRDFNKSRRQVLFNGAGTIAGVVLGCCSVPVAKTTVSEIEQQRFKIGICDWTLGKMAEPAALEAARRLGFDGVQADFGMVEDNLPVLHKPELQKEYQELSQKHNIQVQSFAMGALSSVPLKNNPRGVTWLLECIGVCKAMDVKTVLIPFFGRGDLANDKVGRNAVAERLRQITPKAEETGIVFAIESWLSAAEDMEIIERVGSPAVKVYYDVANSHKAGHDIYEEIRLLGRHICEFHAKDYDGPFGRGSIDFKEVRLAIDDIGYRGWIIFESSLWEPKATLAPEIEGGFLYNLKYLREIFPLKI